MPDKHQTKANLRFWQQTQQDRPFTTRLFRRAVCAIYIFDVTSNLKGLKRKISDFKDLITEECEENIVTILIGNKID